jgi:hypothetical protein
LRRLRIGAILAAREVARRKRQRDDGGERAGGDAAQ